MKRYIIILFATALLLCSCAARQSHGDAEAEVSSGGELLLEAQSEPPEESEEESALGGISYGAYESMFFGFGFLPDEGWTFTPDETLQRMNRGEDLDGTGLRYEMAASADEGLMTASVTAENPAVLYGAARTAEDYILDAIANLPAALEENGMKNAAVERVRVLFAGEEREAVLARYDYPYAEGEYAPVWSTQLAFERDGYFALVTATSFIEDKTGEILGCFYAI